MMMTSKRPINLSLSIDRRVIDPLAMLRAGKVVRLGDAPLTREGEISNNEIPRQESPANWYN